MAAPTRQRLPPPHRGSPARWLLYAVFLLSGVAGLSYELVWVRYVGRIVGASTGAIASTVALFFAGLALGAWLGGKLFDRLRRPLFAYAALEGAIGLAALGVPTALSWLEQASATVDSLPLAFGLAGLILLPATTLLGATFPAMAAALAHLDDAIGSTARFYGLNTAGAVLGCLLTSFVLLPWLGYARANMLMVGIDVVAALLVLVVARGADRAPSSRPVEGSADAPANATSSPRTPTPSPTPAALTLPRAALLAGASGLLAIGVEVLWTRALALSFPATVYVFAVVLAAYLFGIASGALLLPRLTQRFAPLPLLVTLYLLAGVGVLASGLAFPRLAGWFYELVAAGAITRWQGWISGIGLTSLIAMLPATWAMGAALPLLIGLATAEGPRSRVAGRLYMLNVLGGVFGSLLTTFWLMPAVGLSRAITLLAVAYAALALLIVGPAGWRRPPRLLLGSVVVVALLGAGLGHGPDVDPDRAPGRGRRLLYAKDSASGTIAIYEHRQAAGQTTAVPVRSLKINNFYGLNITAPSTVAMQYRLGHLPLLLHPAPRRALLIGFATGNTLAAMVEHELERLDCVELHGELFALARYFEAVNRRVWTNPRVHLVAGDGRRFVLRRGPSYDVVVGDLYLPRNPGAGTLYSREHFRAIYERLSPGGVFVAWLPLWQLSPSETAMIAATFLHVFPQARAYLGNRSAERPVLGLAGRRPKGGSPSATTSAPSSTLERRLDALIAQDLQRIYRRPLPPPPAGELPTQLPAGLLQRWAQGSTLNTLDNAAIEYSAPRTLTQLQLRRQSPAAANLKRLRELLARPLSSGKSAAGVSP